jgi:rare lipoprotein A (peptidoglycan hydrolase)
MEGVLVAQVRFRATVIDYAANLLFLVFGSKHAEAEKGLASWYGPGLNGLPTASGETFNADGHTAASQTLPLGTRLSVSYGGRSVPVTVNDRGPFVDGRDLDLSQGVAQALGLTQASVDYVDYSYVTAMRTSPVLHKGQIFRNRKEGKARSRDHRPVWTLALEQFP